MNNVVGAIVRHKKKVLCLRRAPHESFDGLWEIPSGHVEAGEEADEALERELREETSLVLQDVEREVSSFVYGENLQRNFVVDTTGDVEISPEHDKYAWVSPDHPGLSQEVRDVLRDLP